MKLSKYFRVTSGKNRLFIDSTSKPYKTNGYILLVYKVHILNENDGLNFIGQFGI